MFENHIWCHLNFFPLIPFFHDTLVLVAVILLTVTHFRNIIMSYTGMHTYAYICMHIMHFIYVLVCAFFGWGLKALM